MSALVTTPRNRMPVRHRFSERHDVGLEPETLMPPEMTPQATESRLDLIGNDKSARLSDLCNGGIEETRVKSGKPLIGEVRTDDQRSEAVAGFVKAVDRGLNRLGKRVGFVLVELALGSARADWRRDMTDPRSIAAKGLLSRPQVTDEVRVAMVGVVCRDDPGLAGCHPRHPQRDVIGLGSAAHKDGGSERVGKLRGQALDIVQNSAVQVTGMGVQPRGLFAQGRNDSWMAVPDVRDIVVAIEIAFSIRIPKPGSLASHDVDGFIVEGRRVRTQQPMPSFQQVVSRSHELLCR